MTYKEKKSKIADILMDFQEEYSNDVINRPMLASLYAGNILSFIDSMQKEPVNKQNLSNVERTTKNWKEEPVSIDFEQELYKAFGQVKDFTLGVRIAKRFYDMGKKSREPVNDDLKKAAENYAFTMSGEDEVLKYDAFTSGAKWQKAKDEFCSKDLGEYINELSKQFPEVSFAKLSRIGVRVAKWQKEQMMANATEVTVHIDAGGYPYIPQVELYDYDKDIPLAKEGDKYKVVFIEED